MQNKYMKLYLFTVARIHLLSIVTATRIQLISNTFNEKNNCLIYLQ